MYIKEQMYDGKMTKILYPDDGYLLQHIVILLVYGCVTLDEEHKQENYREIPEEQPEQ